MSQDAEKDIMRVLQEAAKPLNETEIALILSYEPGRTREYCDGLSRTLANLADSGKIIRVPGNRYTVRRREDVN